MNFSSFAFLSVLLLLAVLGKYFLGRRSFRHEPFDEDGSLASGAASLTSEYRILKEKNMKYLIDLAYQEAVKSQTIGDALIAFDPVTIPAIVHIAKDPDTSVINEAEGKEQEQIDVMNRAFLENDMGFTFDLQAIRTHVNSQYWNEPCPRCKGSVGYSPMAQNTHEGDSHTLNIWFNNGPPFGYAMLGPPFGNLEAHEGVVVNHRTIYGGSNPKKNLGTLLIHEVGHWLGLDHTFEGESCSGVGDGVGDTAPQKTPTNTCSSAIAEVDTCPEDSLPDPVHNFMNYVDDPCAYSFTPGQALRSHITWELARAGPKQSNIPTSRPTNVFPTSSPSTSFPTRGLRGDKERIRDEIARPQRPTIETVKEDSINCPAVWPGDGTGCVMIAGFNRKKCIYYNYSEDSICTCSNDDLFWTCINGPEVEKDDSADGVELVNSEPPATEDNSNETSNTEAVPEDSSNTNTEATPDKIPALSLTGRTFSINRIP